MAMITFEATEREKRLIERVAKDHDMSVSDYVRSAVYFDMLLSGNREAFKLLAVRGKEKAQKILSLPGFRELVGMGKKKARVVQRRVAA